MWSNLFCGATVSLKRMLEHSHCVTEANTPLYLWSCWNGKDYRSLSSACWRIPGPTYSFADRWPPMLYALYTRSQQYCFPDPLLGDFTNRMACHALLVRACAGLSLVGNHTYLLPSEPLLWPVHLPAWSTLCQHPDMAVACSQSPACHCTV